MKKYLLGIRNYVIFTVVLLVLCGFGVSPFLSQQTNGSKQGGKAILYVYALGAGSTAGKKKPSVF